MIFEFAKHLKMACEVVTGYVYGYTNKSEYLHSWIEVSKKGEIYVIAATLNAM